MRVLITCGPTWVAVDDVRVISNHSSGQMGHLIAQAFLAHKAKVTLLEGAVTDSWKSPSVKVISYRFLEELEEKLTKELKKNYDCVIHAAAVSDFKLAKLLSGKIDSAKSVSLKLIPAPKLIDGIKKISPQTILVGFKLEPDLNDKNVIAHTRGLLEKSGCHWVVANCLNDGYQGWIVDCHQKILAKANSKKKLANELVKLLWKHLNSN